MTLVPYTATDGIPTFKDSFIKDIYDRMESEGLADTVFYDGSCQSADQFLSMMKHGMNRLFVIVLSYDISGVVWLNSFEARSAQFHFCFFNNLRGKKALEVGKDTVCELLYMENGSPLFDVLIGIVPVANVSANRWCRMLDFNVLGVLPSGIYNARSEKSEPAKVYYVERGVYGKK